MFSNHQKQPLRIFKNRFFLILAAEALLLTLMSSSLLSSIFLPEPPCSASAPDSVLVPDSGKEFSSQERDSGKLSPSPQKPDSEQFSDSSRQNDLIQWVDFDVTAEAMKQALHYDINSYLSSCHLDWISLLAFLGARYGGDFSQYEKADMEHLVQKLQNGSSMEELTKDMKYYPYYLEAYTAVLGGLVGEYQIQEPGAPDDSGHSEPVWQSRYGLKAFSPIARHFPYEDYDDFGASRSYGFQRRHLGHDFMGQVGTPIICVESGQVEAIGWNQYGGWRLGIRSFDKKRYYYYAHLRKNYPYHKSLKLGSIVQAGDVIGYLGRTGYSSEENTNNIDTPHLHFGLQLIFDESQKDGSSEIWIDCYELARFLSMNRSETRKNPETKEYYRLWQMKDPAVPGGVKEQNINHS